MRHFYKLMCCGKMVEIHKNLWISLMPVVFIRWFIFYIFEDFVSICSCVLYCINLKIVSHIIVPLADQYNFTFLELHSKLPEISQYNNILFPTLPKQFCFIFHLHVFPLSDTYVPIIYSIFPDFWLPSYYFSSLSFWGRDNH